MGAWRHAVVFRLKPNLPEEIVLRAVELRACPLRELVLLWFDVCPSSHPIQSSGAQETAPALCRLNHILHFEKIPTGRNQHGFLEPGNEISECSSAFLCDDFRNSTGLAGRQTVRFSANVEMKNPVVPIGLYTRWRILLCSEHYIHLCVLQRSTYPEIRVRFNDANAQVI